MAPLAAVDSSPKLLEQSFSWGCYGIHGRRLQYRMHYRRSRGRFEKYGRLGIALGLRRFCLTIPNCEAKAKSASAKQSAVKCSLQRNEWSVAFQLARVCWTCLSHFLHRTLLLGNLNKLTSSLGVLEQHAATHLLRLVYNMTQGLHCVASWPEVHIKWFGRNATQK